MCIYIYIYGRYVHMYMYMHICIHMHICIYVCIFVYIYKYNCRCYTHNASQVYVYGYVQIYTHKHMYGPYKGHYIVAHAIKHHGAFAKATHSKGPNRLQEHQDPGPYLHHPPSIKSKLGFMEASHGSAPTEA